MATAYAALVSLFNNLELIQNHPYHSFSFENKQIQSLLQSVYFLIDFMEGCAYHGGSKEAAEYLERRIAFAALAADDVVESHVVDQILLGESTQLDGKTRSRFLIDLQKVIEEMEFVRRKAMRVQKAHGGFKAEAPTYSAPASSSSSPLSSQKNSTVGFDDVFDQLMYVLIGDDSSLRVTPIVGMGGIGKTTLARKAFEHKSIVQHFDVRLWATISQEYSVEQILLQLLCHQRKSTGEQNIVNELGEQLHKKLWHRRYLIVLDDIWNVEAWDQIQLFFPDDGNQSRVVLTTRQRNVADFFGPMWLAMKFLDEDKSWNLFCEKAFAEEAGCPSELQDIGEKIVKKCKGLPLAIIVVGSHLGKSSRIIEYWESVVNNMGSILNSMEEQCLDILSLSYSHLPIHLKPCFLYMGTFLEDQHISVSDIVKLWIAEGFLKSHSHRMDLEEVGRDYLKDLINRNLISATIRSCNGEALTCKIHDLLRELCLKIAKKEKFFNVVDTPRAIHGEHRVVINDKIPEEKYIEIFDSSSTREVHLVRSLKCKAGRRSFGLRLLRVLNGMERASMKEVDGDFLEAHRWQVNLRYLRCSEKDLDHKRRPFLYLHLPSQISMFWNLQTLIIEGINMKIIAPLEIWEMPQLRHFVSCLISLPDPLPREGFDQLNELVLQNVQIVENLRLSEEVCKRIPHIKELRVAYCDFKRECDEPRQQFCPHNLGCLHELESLGLSFSKEPEWREFVLHLNFPNSLKELYLINFHLGWEELTMMIGSLPKLEVLYLCGLEAGPKWDLIQGGFPCLKSLSIYECPNLIYWNACDSHFPILEFLFLQLSRLDEFPSGIAEIPTLRHIRLINCSELLAISAVRMLVEQEGCGNEGVQLEVYFSDDEEEESFKKKVQQENLTSDNLLL